MRERVQNKNKTNYNFTTTRTLYTHTHTYINHTLYCKSCGIVDTLRLLFSISSPHIVHMISVDFIAFSSCVFLDFKMDENRAQCCDK